ncbi:MAG: hypothetical protein FWG66_12820 [Spirochaetes bacterium]|nr:hypothetical protein [Spirochaetota bacterium]
MKDAKETTTGFELISGFQEALIIGTRFIFKTECGLSCWFFASKYKTSALKKINHEPHSRPEPSCKKTQFEFLEIPFI